ncbi:hypothetical protein PCK2_000257, partial [Pneumocystis canis]
GKTIQAIALIASRKRPKCFQNIYSKTTLVVTPLSIIRQWESEITTKSNLSVLVYHGIGRTKYFKNFESYDVVITTYNILVSEIKDISHIRKSSDNEFNDTTGIFAISWWRLILDEAQTIKNKNSKTTIATCSLKGCNRWCLTGTPIQNSIEELYSLFKFLRIEPLNDFTVWKEQISKTMSQGDDDISFKRLKIILNAIMLRRTKVILQNNINQDKTLLCLPKKIVKYEMIKLDTHEREFYNKLESYTYKNLSKFIKNGIEEKNYTNILCLLLRLRQACNHFVLPLKKSTMDKDTIGISENVEFLSIVNDDINDVISLFDDLQLKNKKNEKFKSWCSFLDNLTEEMEENPSENIYENYKFLTKKELEFLGLDHLIGSNVVRSYMHGFFIDFRLYEMAKSIVNPFAYAEYRKKVIKDKLEKERESRIRFSTKVTKVNNNLAQRLLNKEKYTKKNKNKETPSVFEDERFKDVFNDPEYEIDENTIEFMQLNPTKPIKNTQNSETTSSFETDQDSDTDSSLLSSETDEHYDNRNDKTKSYPKPKTIESKIKKKALEMKIIEHHQPQLNTTQHESFESLMKIQEQNEVKENNQDLTITNIKQNINGAKTMEMTFHIPKKKDNVHCNTEKNHISLTQNDNLKQINRRRASKNTFRNINIK